MKNKERKGKSHAIEESNSKANEEEAERLKQEASDSINVIEDKSDVLSQHQN